MNTEYFLILREQVASKMSLLVYLPRKFDQTHEREQFRSVCKLLKKRYGSREDEMCIFVANYNIGDVETDGFLIKNEGLAILEFKDYGGTINAAENGDWKGVSPEGKNFVVRGGAGRKNPYTQAKINRSAFRPAFAETGALSEEQLKGISSIILFHQNCTFNNTISPGIRWIKVVDEKGLIDCFDDIVSPNFDLEAVDFNNIIVRLALDPEWLVKDYSDIAYLEKNLLPPSEMSSNEESVTESEDSAASGKNELVIGDVTDKQEEPAKVSDTYHTDVNDKAVIVELYYSLFESLGIENGFSLLDFLKDPLPKWARSLDSNGLPYLVISSISQEQVEHIKVARKVSIHSYKSISYWFDSLNRDIKKDNLPKSVAEGQVISDDLCLPKWLESFIYEDMKAEYAPDRVKFSYNLHNNKQEALLYLGTYFPRSFAEAFSIASECFSNENLYRLLSKPELHILDVGCGTGGSSVGLIDAILNLSKSIKKIHVTAIDGNTQSLMILRKIMKRMSDIYKVPIALESAQIPFEDIEDISLLEELLNERYDFILSFKMVNELVSKDVLVDNAYHSFLKIFAPRLNDGGLLILLDVTTKDDKLDVFYPILLNQGANSFVQENQEYRSILPISCALHEDNCKEACFTQKIFHVTHCKKTKDRSKISYRVIVRSGKGEPVKNLDGRVCIMNKYGQPIFCPHTEGGRALDGFKLI